MSWNRLTNFWYEVNEMKWPETKIMWIWWNLHGKNREIMSSKLIFGGFEIYGTIDCETGHRKHQHHNFFYVRVRVYTALTVAHIIQHQRTKLPKKYMICWVEFSEVGKPEVVKDWKLLNTSVIHQHHVAKTYSFTNSNFDFVTCRGARWPRNSNNRETRSRR